MQTDQNQQLKIPNGENLKISILLPYFNEKIGLELYENTLETLKANGTKEENIKLIRVPGALELPFAAQKEIKNSSPDGIIALGVVIKGETDHYDYVCGETLRGLMDVQLKLETPIVFGLLTCETEKQATDRASKEGLNKGKSFAETALIQTI
jgi:6,7-dimethyl-8-ribityllumazine synthase